MAARAPGRDRRQEGEAGGRGKQPGGQDEGAARPGPGKGSKSGKQAVAPGGASAVECRGGRRGAADRIPKGGATAQRLSPTEVYPPCPSPSGPAHRTSGTADRPLFVRPPRVESRGGVIRYVATGSVEATRGFSPSNPSGLTVVGIAPVPVVVLGARSREAAAELPAVARRAVPNRVESLSPAGCVAVEVHRGYP